MEHRGWQNTNNLPNRNFADHRARSGPPQTDDSSSKVLLVRHFPGDFTHNHLFKLFSHCGTVTYCYIRDECGFVYMNTPEEADNAISHLNHYVIFGHTITVERLNGEAYPNAATSGPTRVEVNDSPDNCSGQSQTNVAVPRTKLFVGHLPFEFTDEDLCHLFSQCGTVEECDVIGQYGFVHMSTPEEADNAISRFNNYELRNSKLSVERSTSKLHTKPGEPGRARPKAKMTSNNSRQRPVSSRDGVPQQVSSQANPPVSSRMNQPVSSQATQPVSSRTNLPVSSQANLSVSSRVNLPVSSQANMPVSSRVNLPVSSRANLPVSSRESLPISSRANQPVSSRVNPPSQVDQSVNSQGNWMTYPEFSLFGPYINHSQFIRSSLEQQSTNELANDFQRQAVITSDITSHNTLPTTHFASQPGPYYVNDVPHLYTSDTANVYSSQLQPTPFEAALSQNRSQNHPAMNVPHSQFY